jgi:uncharacterized protein (TIRG00374 family)
VIATALRYLFPFAISAILLAVVVHGLGGDWPQLVAALRDADWRLIPLAIGLFFLGIWIRSIRWGQLLPEQAIKTSTLFSALVVGLTVNNLLPFRMGEIARAYLLGRWCQVPYGTTAASLVVERVLDGLSLALLLLVALALVPAPTYLLVGGVVAAVAFVSGALVLAIAAWRADSVVWVGHLVAARLPAHWGAAVDRLAVHFARALVVVHDPSRLARVLGLSILAWCCELGLFYVLMLSLRLAEASYALALLVGSAANFATLVPSSPGYVGTFDGVLIRVLQDTSSIAAGQATAFDVVVHTALFLPVVVVGTLVLWRSHMSFGQITHATDREATPAGGDLRAA